MSSSCFASSSKLSPFSSLKKKKRENVASRNSSRVRSSLDPSPSVVGLPNNDSMMISTASSPTSLKMMMKEEKEEGPVVVVVFTNFNETSYLKYPKSLPEYSEDKKPSGEVSWKEVWEHMRLRLKWSNWTFETLLVDGAETETVSKAKDLFSKATAFIAC